MLVTFSKSLDSYFEKAPFLEVCFYILLAFGFLYSVKIPFFILLLLFSYLRKKVKMFPSIIFALSLCYLHLNKPPDGKQFEGSVYLQVADKRVKTLFGKRMYSYKAIARVMEDKDGNKTYNIPCIYTSKYRKNLKGDTDYYISSVTLAKTLGRYAKLKINKESSILPIEKTRSLSYMRFMQKQKAERHLKNHIENKKVLKLLSALTLGYLDNKTLNYEFSKLGLSHLLAISGFHFALLSFFLYIFLRAIPFRKLRSLLLLSLLLLYVLYLGGSSSVMRAFLGILIYIFASLIGLKPRAINTLAIVFVISFLADPNCLLDAGFQLSYSATFAILVFYKPLENSLRLLIPKRNSNEVLFWPFFDKCLYLLLTLLRKNLALSVAVSSATLPILLNTFERFPLLSLFYNLFIPLLISFAMVLLLLGFTFSPIQAISHMFHSFNESYTSFLLTLIEEVPKQLELFIYKNTFTLSLSVLAAIIIFISTINYYFKADNKALFS
ncbi:MAG: hypothetical protein S4CHLAM37_02910 [Chlamydiia bacterium]|nr:hypothetical protein [Chlamydiia bacterium]